MTPQQEKKIDDLIVALGLTNTSVAVLAEKMKNAEEEIKEHAVVIKDYEANKNKGKGAAIVVGFIWLGITGAISFAISYYTKH